MADRRCQPCGQLVLNTEHYQPFIPPDSSRQLDDRLLGKIRPEPFDGPDDIAGKAIADPSSLIAAIRMAGRMAGSGAGA